MDHHIRTPTKCISENKVTDQLRSNCEVDQCLCFRYLDSTTFLLFKSEISMSVHSICVYLVGNPDCWFIRIVTHISDLQTIMKLIP